MTRPDLIAEIRRLRAAWRDSDNAYRREPLAATRVLNENDKARERMAALRAKRRNRP